MAVYTFLPLAYVVRREGNSFTLSVHTWRGGGGVPISHNALQHFPECHGADTGGGGTLPGPAGGGGTLLGGTHTGGYPARGTHTGGGTLPGGCPARGVPCQGGYQSRVPPARSGQGGGTQLGQQKEHSLHGGRHASCVHTGGLSCGFGIFEIRRNFENWCLHSKKVNSALQPLETARLIIHLYLQKCCYNIPHLYFD